MFSQRRPKCQVSGVTWFEIVVVVWIVGAIVAVMWPVLRLRGQIDRYDTAPFNLKQIALGLYQYVQDADGCLPPLQTVDNHRRRVSWRAVVVPYVDDRYRWVSLDNAASDWPDAERDGFRRSYAGNSTDPGADLLGGPFLSRDSRAVRASTYRSPSQTIAIVESTSAQAGFDVLKPLDYAQPASAGAPSGYLFAHSFQSHVVAGPLSNFLFLDGHVKAMDPPAAADSSYLWTGAALSPRQAATERSVLAFSKRQSRHDDRRTGYLGPHENAKEVATLLGCLIFPFLLAILVIKAYRWRKAAAIALVLSYVTIYVMLSLGGRYELDNGGGDDWSKPWCPRYLATRFNGDRPHVFITPAASVFWPCMLLDRWIWHHDADPTEP